MSNTLDTRVDHPEDVDIRDAVGTMDIAQIVEACKQGDSEAWATIVDRFRLYVLKIIYNARVQNPNDADEVCQEVFLKVFRNIHDVYDPTGFYHWLGKIAYNSAKHRLRYAKRHPVETLGKRSLTLIIKDTGPVHDVLVGEISEEVHQCLEDLPESDRFLLEGWYLHERSFAELARDMNKSASAIKSHMDRARDHLREELRKRHVDFAAV